MRRMRVRHVALSLGAVLLVSATFVPWLTIYAFYYPSVTTTFVWSPFDIVWNALMSVFPGSPEVNAWLIEGATPLVISSLLYVGSALAIAGLAIPLIRFELRGASVETLSWPLLATAGLAAVVTLFFGGVVPFIYAIAGGSNVDLRPFDGAGVIGIALALAGAALAFFALFGISISAHDQRRGLGRA